YTADGAQIRSTNYWTGTYNQYMDLEAGTYYIEITPYSTSYTGTYFLTATLAEADHNNIEPNNTTDDAQSLMPEERVRGFISYQDNADYYSILLPEAGRLTVIVTRDSLTDMYVRWYTADGAQIRSTNYWTGTYSQNMDLEAGTYYIEITPYSTSYTGSYFITADIAPAYNNEIEPNNVIPGEAQLIRSGELIKGFISHQDDIDLYKVELTQKGALSLTITNDSFTTYSSVITVRLYNGITGAEEIPSYSISFSSSNSSRTNTTPGDLEAGIYYILIQKITSYTGAYFLRAEFPPDSLSQTWSTITYNSNGGSGAPPSHAKTPGKAVALSSVYPTRDNYWFLGWSTSNNAVTAQYQPSDFYTTESNLNLFAIWEQILGAPYTITYNANLGLGAPNPQTKTNGADLTLSTTMPTRTNFNFLGWATNSSTDVEEYMPGELYTKDEVTTLYAVWYPVAPSYTITYNANGGVGAPASQVKTHGTSIRLSNLRPTWGNNHVFLGWASSGTATTAQFAPGVTYSIDADRTLYAVWSTTGNTTFVPVMSITGVPSSATAGTPTALTGTVNPSNATNRTISWSTLNAGTTGATITGNTLNSTSAGAVTVRATIVNGLTGATNYTQDFNITVNTIFIPVANITGVPSTATVGTPLALTGTVNPSNATNRTITWSVQNAGTTGTTITGNTFNATSAGAVTIRATIVNGLAGATNYTQDFTITVNAAFIPVTSITGAPSTVTVGTPLTLTGTVNPSTATNRTISWSVQNAGTTGATITGNTFNATSAGVVSVRATIINGVTATTNYTQDFSITVNTVSPTPTQSQSSGGSGSGGGGGIAPPVTPTPTPTPTPTHTPTPTPTPTALPKTDSNKESGDDENITKTLSRRQRTTINNWVPSGPVSEWAVPEIQRAFELDLIPESLVSEGLDFTAPITRVEFAGIAVKAYENLAESRVQINGSNPFIDTNDPDALKAFSAGIMIGYSDERFEPYILLNREQCATALTRVFKRAMIDDWTYETDSNYPLNFTWPAPFDDDAVISIWAKESVYFMAANGIIHGIGNNRFAPRATTSTEEATGYALATREEAIAIAVRMVDTFR
ncbi:MAG: InlB B-repeat-containing protein, partial [Oscillospiraceae bacterium]|nr:InlB B-repeat-containing protein [Oscillospiraceae bacterium]